MESTHNDNAEKTEEIKDTNQYPTKKILIPAMAAIYLSVFLVALDRTIIGTAIPKISNEFDSFGDVAWYESGFLLPLCAFQLSFGLVYTHYSSKWFMVILVAIFEIGSILCAAAPSSNVLIIGRVVQGIGGAGITSGAQILISMLVPLAQRPQWTGGMGAVFGVASICGPLLGGYLTAITWRWCFWLNVPVGGVSLACLVFLTPNRLPAKQPAPTWRGKIDQLDPLGFVLVAPSVICLLFAIEWGGSKYAWNSGTIIALFVVFGILLLAFIASQIWRGDKATLPPRILRQRSIISAAALSIGIGAVLVLYAFYLPIWFQVIQGKSPQSSGLSLLPLLLSNVLAVIATGVAITLTGYYTPFLIIGSCILIVGAALLTTWSVNVGAGVWIGFQIVLGVGLGSVLQGPNIAAQTVLPDKDVSIGLSFLQFVTFFSGSTFVTVAQTLLESKLVSGLGEIIPNLDPKTISDGGATAIRGLVSADKIPAVLKIYNDSIKSIWYLGLALSCLVFVTAWGFEWRSIKPKNNKNENHTKA